MALKPPSDPNGQAPALPLPSYGNATPQPDPGGPPGAGGNGGAAPAPAAPPTPPPAPPSIPEDVDLPEKNAIGDKLNTLKTNEIDFLARKVQEEFSRYSSGRLMQEAIWLEAHQNFKGVYPADMDFQNGSSRAFVQATRPRVVTGVAVLAPIILPPGDKSFTVDPSPNPYMPKLAAKLVGGGMPADQVRAEVMAEAQKRSDAMSNRVEDGLAETGWNAKFLRTCLDMCLYGTSVMMGPMAVALKKKSYEKQSVWERVKSIFTGAYAALQKMGLDEEFRPELEVISPFDFYPDTAARTIEECDSAIVRKVVNRASLREWRSREGFDKKAIDKVLEEMPEGNWTMEGSWEGTINLTNSQQAQSAPSGRFVCLVRWGWLSGRDLQKAGIKVDRDQLEEQIMAQTWVVGHHVIALLVSELHQTRLPFYVTPYSLVPHSIWGSGLAEMMRDSQAAINAYERMKMDNAAMCAGPQIIIDMSRLVTGQSTAVRPRKTWLVRQNEAGSTMDPVKIIMPECRVGEYQASQDKALQFAQEQTNMPNMLMGFGGEGIHNRTSSGASMQFNSAITPMKTVIFNIENHLIVPMIEAMCRFYIEFSKDETIRGDHKVIAKGVQGLMAREAISQKIATILQFVGQRQEWAAQMDLDAIFKLMIRDSGLSDVNIVLPPAVVLQRQQAALQMQNQEAGNAAAQQGQAEKERAVSDPKDAIIDLAKLAPDGGKTSLALLGEALTMWNFMTPEVQKAMSDDLQLTHMDQMTQADAHGQAQGPHGITNEAPEPPPAPAMAPPVDPREAGRAEEKHQMDMKLTQAKIEAIKNKPKASAA